MFYFWQLQMKTNYNLCNSLFYYCDFLEEKVIFFYLMLYF